jgi:SAM-dependent methyltransferase
MAFEFHSDWVTYFNQQYENSKYFVLPFIAKSKKIGPATKVMEIGCGEGGVLKAFTDLGCQVVGVDLSPARVKMAEAFMEAEIKSGLAKFIAKNIYDVDFQQDFAGYFDVIILKDSIEHIPDQEKIIAQLHQYIAKDGVIFFGFPPWYMPFGGHQQIAKHKLLSKLPYYHLLPVWLYKPLLEAFGESEPVVTELLEIKETGISIERFERICKKTGFKIVATDHYLINPIYRSKFNLKPRKQFRSIRYMPFLRNFLTTCVYYLISPKQK